MEVYFCKQHVIAGTVTIAQVIKTVIVLPTVIQKATTEVVVRITYPLTRRILAQVAVEVTGSFVTVITIISVAMANFVTMSAVTVMVIGLVDDAGVNRAAEMSVSMTMIVTAVSVVLS